MSFVIKDDDVLDKYKKIWDKIKEIIKTGSQRSRRLLSMFTRVLRRVRLSIIYVGQWRRKCAVDSISKPQLQNRFKKSWKLCLNLC